MGKSLNFCIAPDTDIGNLFKSHGLIGCLMYYEQSNGFVIRFN